MPLLRKNKIDPYTQSKRQDAASAKKSLERIHKINTEETYEAMKEHFGALEDPHCGNLFIPPRNEPQSDCTEVAGSGRMEFTSNEKQSSVIIDIPYKSVLNYNHLADQVEEYRDRMPESSQEAVGKFIAVLREAAENVHDHESDLDYINKVMDADDAIEDTMTPETFKQSLHVRAHWGEQMLAASQFLKNPRVGEYHPSQSKLL